MPSRSSALLTPDHRAALLNEAVRRVDAAIPDAVDISVLRQALETEMAKGPCTLAELMKVGRRRMLDRATRADRKALTRC